ncbi:hypothetical protein C7S18_20185 [Ahniella affigens]|uniref:Uncharacterized protein n=1 Tax=Ahniella affigens TaxID=2021234 RepID=A0A2P1PWY0_9GAMM|nr:hypothetical protein [Ahniella affigens]AVP99346.1 hypothetical protein C7S18_20185 [Ahniella affigens]
MRTFEDIRKHVSSQFELNTNDAYQLSFDFLTADGRTQGVFLGELEAEAARRYLRVSTPVAPLSTSDAARALEFNWAQRVGYLALFDLDGEPYLHLCENRPYSSLDAGEIDAVVREVATLADRLEQLLRRGEDVV